MAIRIADCIKTPLRANHCCHQHQKTRRGTAPVPDEVLLAQPRSEMQWEPWPEFYNKLSVLEKCIKLRREQKSP